VEWDGLVGGRLGLVNFKCDVHAGLLKRSIDPSLDPSKHPVRRQTTGCTVHTIARRAASELIE
jgi:hypothetical protein